MFKILDGNSAKNTFSRGNKLLLFFWLNTFFSDYVSVFLSVFNFIFRIVEYFSENIYTMHIDTEYRTYNLLFISI